MTRKKIKLAFIANQADRKASYKKRKRGLMKKVEELSTLCGIDACAILYGPYENEPEMWPSSPHAMHRVLSRFKNLPEMERHKRMVNQEGFTKNRIEKLTDQLKKQKKDNRDKEVTDYMYKCLGGESVQNFGLAELNDMGWLIHRNLKELTRRVAYRKKCVPRVVPPAVTMVPLETSNITGGDNNGSMVAAPQMPMNDGQMLNLPWEMGMLSTNEQPDLDDFGWDDPFLPSIVNNNGAGPSYSSVP